MAARSRFQRSNRTSPETQETIGFGYTQSALVDFGDARVAGEQLKRAWLASLWIKYSIILIDALRPESFADSPG
jgi:hypothetical protein